MHRFKLILNNPTLRLFIGAALISLSAVWVKLVNIPPSASAFYRVLFGGLALSLFLIATRKKILLSKKIWLLLVVASFFLVLDLWFWHRSIVAIGPGLSTLLANLQVFIIMFAGIIFLRQFPTSSQLLALPLAIVGLFLIIDFDRDYLSERYNSGIIYGLLTAVAYACYILVLKSIRNISNYRIPTREVAIVSIMASFTFAIIVILEEGFIELPVYKDLGWLLAYGILSHCLGWLFIVSSLSQVSAMQAGIALLLQPTLSFFWDILFFDRLMTYYEIIGAIITIAAIYLGTRATSKQS